MKKMKQNLNVNHIVFIKTKTFFTCVTYVSDFITDIIKSYDAQVEFLMVQLPSA